MTDNSKNYSFQIDKALSSKDFNLLFTLFVTNHFSFTELLIFYKRNKGIFKLENFWTSQLPHFHLEAILESGLKITFLQSYFLANANCNTELDKHLLIIAKSDFIKHFKLWKAFEHSDFLNSLKQISQSDSEIVRIVKELEIIIKAQNRILAEEKEDNNYFLQFTFGEIAFAFTLYYSGFKQDEQIGGNKNWQTKIEATLVDELHNIISLFKGKSNMVFQFTSNEELQKQFIHDNKKLDNSLEPKFLFLFNLIERLIDRNARRGQVQLYLCGYSDFDSVTFNPAPLKSNESFRTFKINDCKSVPEEFYFSPIRLNFDNFKIPDRTDISKSMEILKFYGIPNLIKRKSDTIEINKALQILKHFSVFKGPIERNIIPGKSFTIMNQGDKKFIELFGANESISLFDFESLKNGIANYFEWSELETKSTLSFLTWEITATELPNNWINSPFIKYNNQVLWLGSFLKDRRWDNILMNKLKKEFEYRTLVNPISNNFELRIEELFKSKSFKTISGVKFSSSNKQSGDFDVLAFKDNYLIVCEAKTGTRSNEFFHASYSEMVRLEGCAADQLEKAIFNIKEDWTNIKTKLGLDEEVSFNSIKIFPIIITDYFEGDLQLYKNSYRKISLLELDVILKNKRKDLLEMYLIHTKFNNPFNPDLKQIRSINKDWDLWGGKKDIEVEEIILNIEKNTIWEEIETIWKFEDEKYLIDY